jgi:hypothetical protein
VCEVLCCEFRITQSKYVIGRVCERSDVFFVGFTRLFGLPIDGLHMNDYNGISAIVDKVFIQNTEQILVVL